MAGSETIDGRAERGAVTRSALLRSARAAFCEQGYAAASVRVIAARAGVHPALVTYHFGSKARLWSTLVGPVGDDLRRRVQVAAAGEADPWRRALAGCDALAEHVHAHPLMAGALLREGLGGDPLGAATARRYLQPLVALWSEAAATGTAARRNQLAQRFGAAVAPTLWASLLAEVFDRDDDHTPPPR